MIIIAPAVSATPLPGHPVRHPLYYAPSHIYNTRTTLSAPGMTWHAPRMTMTAPRMTMTAPRTTMSAPRIAPVTARGR